MAKRQSKRDNGQPITRHPLFPAVVALWFGALLGLGSLAVRASLIEELVVATRLDLILPAAAPPLGMTARMLLALGLAAFGAMLGAWFGRKLAYIRPEKRERRRQARDIQAEPIRHATNAKAPAEPWVQPIEPEIRTLEAEAGVWSSSSSVLPGRRRSLTVADEEPVFELTEYAPLPGGPPQIFEVASTGIAPIGAEPVLDKPMPEALPPFAEAATNPASELEVAAIPVDLPPHEVRQVFRVKEAECSNSAAPEPMPVPPPVSSMPARLPAAPAATPVAAQISPAAPEDRAPSPAPENSAFAQPAPPPLFAARPPLPAAAIPQAAPPAPIAPDAPLEDLATRLAEAMRRRREARATVPQAVPVATDPTSAPSFNTRAAGYADIPATLRPVQAQAQDEGDIDLVLPSLFPPRLDPGARAEIEASLKQTQAAPTIPSPRELPPAMRPIDTPIDAEIPIDQELDSLLPPRQLFVPPAAPSPVSSEPDETADEESGSEANDYRFSSLLAVAPKPDAFRSGFVRVEEPSAPADVIEPVVIFPGQALARNHVPAPGVPSSNRLFDPPTIAPQQPPASVASMRDQEETDRALKLALANLQRMSGAA